MALQGRDPRSGQINGAPTGYPANSNTIGGYLDAAMVDLGNGTGAVLTIPATRNKSVIAGSAASEQLLAANSDRVAATIVNTDGVKTMYIGLNGAVAVVGTNPVLPGAAYNVPAAVVAGQTNGIWDAGVTGNASITETIA